MTADAETGLVYRSIEAGEGAKLVACLRRCYGDSHVDFELYDAAGIDAALAVGRRVAAVALDTRGDVVGHIGFVLRHPEDNTADAGLTLVDPQHRGRGIAHRLAVEIGRMALRRGLIGVHDYPVTVHGATQRLASDHALAVGLLLDNMPGSVEWRDLDAAGAGGATASLVRYMGLAPAPCREVHLPAVYREFGAALYARGGLERALLDGAEAPVESRTATTAFEVHGDARRRVTRIAVTRIGRDVSELLDAVGSASKGVVQTDLPLADPAAPSLAGMLCQSGHFFGALLPEFRAGDVLRLQRLPDPSTSRAVPVLEGPAMRALADFVLADAARVGAQGIQSSP